ncbi:MAG: aminoacyl-tRNA hydrolase [Miltoncostaeaceae bacterium]
MSHPVRLIVGLGNPGPRYERTRHNAGARALDVLARRWDAGRARERFAGEVREARGPGGPLVLLAPSTYMNESGRSVGPATGSMKLDPEQVLVLHDEIDLPFGEVRGKEGGGHGGNNGLRSIIAGLGTGDFGRVRLGVGRPGPDFGGDEAAWVLSAHAEPAEEVDRLLVRGADMAEAAAADGLAAAIAKFHARPPGSRSARRRDARGEDEPTPEGGDEVET